MQDEPTPRDLDDLVFGDYWPPGSPDLVREFLRTEYDPETMPPLIISRTPEGEFRLIGWEPEPDGPGLLEAARGWALTENEEAWTKFRAEGGAL